MKFTVKQNGNFWEVGFMNQKKEWVCIQAVNNKDEADELCKKMIGGNKFEW